MSMIIGGLPCHRFHRTAPARSIPGQGRAATLRCRTKGALTMIDFYALTSPNVQKIFVMLEETELAYKPIYVDVWKGDNFKPEFQKLNPNAKIPVKLSPFHTST